MARNHWTDRQVEVVRLIAEGYSNVEIGELLGVSPRTAKAHTDAIRSKLGRVARGAIPAAYWQATGENPYPRTPTESRRYLELAGSA